jgi:hypothetical protein
MELYPYWARVDVDYDGNETAHGNAGFTGTGWSDRNPQHARAKALEHARRLLEWWRNRDPQLQSRYAYTDQTIREPIVDEQIVDGQRFMAITRNGYGAYVLNTANVFFADIDVPFKPVKSFRNALRAFLLQPQENAFTAHDSEYENAVIDTVHSVARTHNLGMRLYRTNAGHRAVITSTLVDPRSDQSRKLLAALGSDEKYIHLCSVQKCYRARLTPKPWRIGMPRPDRRLCVPWRTEQQEAQFNTWVEAVRDEVARLRHVRTDRRDPPRRGASRRGQDPDHARRPRLRPRPRPGVNRVLPLEEI